METLFSSGRVADLILLVLAIEAVAVVAARRLMRAGLRPRDVLPFLAAGAGFALALRAALTDAPWEWIAAWLGLAFVAHLFDLGLRWRRDNSD